MFVDCGANIGVFTVAAALRVGHRGRVISFEPDPRTRQLLVDNVERHRVDRQVTVHAEAGFFEAPSYPSEVARSRDVDVVRLDDAVDGQTPQSLLDRFPPGRWALWLVDEEATGAPAAVRPFDHVARGYVDRAGPNWYGNLLVVPRHREDQIAATITRLG